MSYDDICRELRNAKACLKGFLKRFLPRAFLVIMNGPCIGPSPLVFSCVSHFAQSPHLVTHPHTSSNLNFKLPSCSLQRPDANTLAGHLRGLGFRVNPKPLNPYTCKPVYRVSGRGTLYSGCDVTMFRIPSGSTLCTCKCKSSEIHDLRLCRFLPPLGLRTLLYLPVYACCWGNC